MANTINCFHVKIENWKSKQDRRKLHGCSTRFMKDCEKTEILKISLKYPISRNTHIRSGKKGRHETNLALVLSCVVGVLTICHVPRLVVWLFGCLVVWWFVCWLVDWLMSSPSTSCSGSSSSSESSSSSRTGSSVAGSHVWSAEFSGFFFLKVFLASDHLPLPDQHQPPAAGDQRLRQLPHLLQLRHQVKVTSLYCWDLKIFFLNQPPKKSLFRFKSSLRNFVTGKNESQGSHQLR